MQVQAIDFESGFEDAFNDVITLLPKILYFLVILVVGLFLAKAVQKILTKVLQRVGFDQMVERGGIRKALSKSKYDAAEILGKIVYYFIFLLVLSAAFGVFGSDNSVSQFLAEIVAFLPRLFVAVLALIIAAAIAAGVKDLLSNMLGGLSFGTVIANAASIFILALGVFFALSELEIAPLIVGGIFYALLALVIIPPIIAFGVGGIDPARETIRDLQSKGRQKADEAKQELRSDDPAATAGAPTAPVRRTRGSASATGAAATPTRRRRPTA